jgi:Uma2 family endonuclease
MSKTAIKIGPADHGRQMSLDDFEQAEEQEGYVYELSRGIITVSDVPNKSHLFQVYAVRRQLSVYDISHPGPIRMIASGNECKVPIVGFASERHPDVSVYLSPAPDVQDEELWMLWVPEIVIEVISPSSRQRDYEEKPAEYLRFGVKEYWIVDAEKRVMVVMRRSRGRWAETTVKPPAIYRPRLRPGFEFSIDDVFKSAGLI